MTTRIYFHVGNHIPYRIIPWFDQSGTQYVEQDALQWCLIELGSNIGKLWDIHGLSLEGYSFSFDNARDAVLFKLCWGKS